MAHGQLYLDNAPITKAQKTLEGFLRIQAVVGVVGDLVYLNQDGTERVVQVTPEVLFDPVSMDSFAQKPVTLLHPGIVDPTNARQHVRGATGQVARIGPNTLGLATVIFDEEMIASIESAETPEVSSGYFADADLIEGNRYRQRNRIGNHVAGVPLGRAGPAGRFLMDSKEDLPDGDIWLLGERLPINRPKFFDQKPEKSMSPTFKITLDGAEFQVDEALQGRFKKWQQDQNAKLTELQSRLESKEGEYDGLRARFDALNAEFDELKAKGSGIDENEIVQRVATLLKVAPDAEKLKLELDIKMPAIDIQRAWLKARGIDVEGKSDGYVNGRFDAEQVTQDGDSKGASSGGKTFAELLQDIRNGRGGGEKQSSSATDYRENMRKRIDSRKTQSNK